MQERLYFRNIPLSNWVEHEMLVDETHSQDIQQLAKNVSLFSTKSIPEAGPAPTLIDSIAAFQQAS